MAGAQAQVVIVRARSRPVDGERAPAIAVAATERKLLLSLSLSLLLHPQVEERANGPISRRLTIDTETGIACRDLANQHSHLAQRRENERRDGERRRGHPLDDDGTRLHR